MSDLLKSIAKQLLPIFLSGLAAAAIAFAQSVAAHAGMCAAPVIQPEQVGLLGGAFKALHSIATAASSGQNV